MLIPYWFLFTNYYLFRAIAASNGVHNHFMLHVNGAAIFLLMRVSENASRTTLKIPNSPPRSGRIASAPAAPREERTVLKMKDPQAAQPIPSAPLAIPPNPAATSGLARRVRVRFKK